MIQLEPARTKLRSVATATYGVVAIGRNEEPRLAACLRSVGSEAVAMVYVDSGSTDDSVALAESLGAEVVRLDTNVPFTAARARNAGFARLLEVAPDVEFVQFVDGDCSFADGWLETATVYLEAHPEVTVVCGRRRERAPQASIFNQLCDVEWNTPVGEAWSCGGDALMRVAAVRAVGGYNEAVIAAEDDELCVRLRQNGGRVMRVDHDMTWHDANMHTLRQWWRRAVRAGHGFAQGFAMHGAPPERHFAKELRSALVQGLAFPAIAIGLLWPTRGLNLLVMAGFYLLQWGRISLRLRRQGLPKRTARAYALNCVAAKFAGAWGALTYYWRRWRRSGPRIIEYK